MFRSTTESEAQTERTGRLIRILAGYHLGLAAVAAATIAVAAIGTVGLPVIVPVTLVGSAVAIGSTLAYLWLRRNQHRGRVASLIVNYLLFLAAFFTTLHRIGVFVGIDALAGTFGRGIVFLLLAVIGYAIRSRADRYESSPAKRRRVRAVGRWTVRLSLSAFLLAIRAPAGIWFLLRQFDDPITIGVALASVVTAAAIWPAWRRPTAVYLHATMRDSEMIDGLLFLSPNLLGFLVFFAGPFVLSLYVSFTNWDAFGTREWIGLANYGTIFDLTVARLANPDQLASEVIDTTRYGELFRFGLFGRTTVVGARDPLFWISLGNTLVFVLLAVPLSVAPAILLANVLNAKLPGMKVFRAVYFVPSVAAVVGVALIWEWLYNSTVGWINYLIGAIVDGINAALGASITDPTIGWLSDARVALLAIVIVASWQWVGFNTVLFLAGLQAIPSSLYEAATVDGAGRRRKFWRITLPLLAPTTFFVVTVTSIQAIQIFDQVWVLTNPPGGPGTSTMTMVLYLYRNGFQNFRLGYASSIAWVLFMVIFALTWIRFRRERGARIE